MFSNFPDPISDRHFKHYQNLVLSRLNRILDKSTYTENHHILPKSMGGLDAISNYIQFTAREHYLAHHMLYLAFGGKMSQAFFFMSTRSVHKDKFESKLTSREYQELRQDYSKIVSEQMKGNTYASCPNSEKQKEAVRVHMTGKKDKPETTEKRRQARLGLIPITDGKENKFIQSSEAIPEGFKHGHVVDHTNTSINAKRFREERKEVGEVWIHKNNETKFILITDLQKYLDSGWLEGRGSFMSNESIASMKAKKKGLKWMYHEDISKQVSAQDVKKYLEEGWQLGRKRKIA